MLYRRASSITLCFGSTRSFPARSYENLCLSIAADIGDKVLSKEYTERNRANLAWTRDGFAYARTNDLRAIMLILQADPHFDLDATNRLRRGFNEFLSLIEKETLAFKKPVVFVHGDSHYFRIDKPLLGSKSKRRIENFTRVETFGAANTHWVAATIDPRDPNLFEFSPRIVPGNVNDR